MSNNIRYDFTDIYRLADALRANGKALVQQTEILEGSVQKLNHTFQSNGQKAYNEKMGKWKAELSDTQQILESIARRVEDAARDMKIADDRAAANIGG